MKILAVADTQDRALGEHFDPDRWRDVDLLISCGDLDPDYLDYLVSRMNVRCLYVRGNHDTAYVDSPPGGCDNISGRVVRHKGLRIAGLDGSRWYGGKGIEYSDRWMGVRAWRLSWKIRFAGGVDILVTHSPPAMPPPPGHPPPDRVHAGFECFTELAERHRPVLFLHGHTHLGYGRGIRERLLGSTRVVDCYGSYLIELNDSELSTR